MKKDNTITSDCLQIFVEYEPDYPVSNALELDNEELKQLKVDNMKINE